MSSFLDPLTALEAYQDLCCPRRTGRTARKKVAREGQRDGEKLSEMKGCQKKRGNYWPFLMEMLMK